MKKLLLFFLISFTTLNAQYSVKSSYLKNPETIIGYVDSCAKFWLKAYDQNNGGFFTNVDRFGNPLLNWGSNKNMISQSRNAYGMTRAYMLTGKDEYLEKAQQALDFIYDHAWDKTNGGWFNYLSQTGVPNSNEEKNAFDQHYALLGISAYYEATNDSIDYNWLIKGYQNNESKLWDNRTGFEGYYDHANSNWSNKSAKSFNATVDAITTHILYLYLMSKDEVYKNKLIQISENMMTHLYGNMDSQAIGFPEEFNSDWKINQNETMSIMGHILKTAWCLGRVNQISPNSEYISAAEKLIQNVLDKGYDHQFGGPYKDFNRVTGEMLMWGQDTAKAWWQMEQAITAGLELYDITKNEKYLKMADETLDFFMKYFVDHIYGEVYSDRLKRGGQVWGLEKGNGYKAAYHSIETGYYVYLYGNLFFKNAPVTLYYNFKLQNTDREILLYPLAIEDNELKIKEIQLDGISYNNFNPTTRILNLPGGVGGEFQVTFERSTTTSVADNENSPRKFALNQNYPNPFNPTTAISYQLSVVSKVELKVFDILGREVQTLVNEIQNAGSYKINFNASDLPSGIYIYQIIADNFVESKKMMLVK